MNPIKSTPRFSFFSRIWKSGSLKVRQRRDVDMHMAHAKILNRQRRPKKETLWQSSDYLSESFWFRTCLSLRIYIETGMIKLSNKPPVTKNGNLNPPASNSMDPRIGPDSIPSPVKVYVSPIKLPMLSSKSQAIMLEAPELRHPLPNPSMNLQQKDSIPYS